MSECLCSSGPGSAAGWRPWPSPQADFAGCARAARLLKECRPDLVHTNTAAVFPSYGFAARATGVPHVAHIRESFGGFGVYWRLFQWLVAMASDRIIAVSSAVGEQFAPRFRTKVRVIHNGFPVEEFAPVPAERVAAFRKAFELQDRPAVGVVGRIKLKRKGQETFVATAALLKEQVSRGPFRHRREPVSRQRAPWRRSRSAHPRARRPGHRDTDRRRGGYQGGYFGPGHTGSSVRTGGAVGGVVIEAMAFGKPVVGTRLGGTTEQVEDGATGLLVPPEDPRAMAEAIARLLADPRQRAEMGARGRERYLRLFEFENFYEKVTAVYRSVFDGQRRKGASPE